MLKSWVKYDEEEQFPIQNLPYGVFRRNKEEKASIGVRIANRVLDLRRSSEEGLFKGENVGDALEQVRKKKIIFVKRKL